VAGGVALVTGASRGIGEAVATRLQGTRARRALISVVLSEDVFDPGNDSTRLSAGSVLNLRLVLTQALGQAVRWQLLPSNPAAGAQPPRPRRPPRLIVDQSLAGRLLAAVAGSRLELPAAIAIATGMRRGEILALRWQDLDPGRTVARVQRSLQPTQSGLVFEQPKTARSRRTVALPTFIIPYLETQEQDQATRRDLAGETWTDLDLIIDRGDGTRSTPTPSPPAGPASYASTSSPASASTTSDTHTPP
jgi:integrase